MPPVLNIIDYKCSDCGMYLEQSEVERIFDIPLSERPQMQCRCGGKIIAEGFPSITGTETSFGIRKAFYDPKTGQTIDTYKKWENAGFRDGMDAHSPLIREKVKEYRKRKGKMTIKSKAIEMAERI
jgi:hypothetical protein